MPKFTVHARDVLVGYSRLEHGDPPMGVAYGAFEPAPGYSTVRDECVSNHADQSHLGLAVQTESGEVLACVGVAILDFDAGPGFVEVHVLGIPHPEYGMLFPEHVDDYRRRFR